MWLRIMPQTPLHLGDQTSISNVQESLDYIPGSSLRGAIAAGLLKQGDSVFSQLFDAEEEPYFGNAYFAGLAPVYPFPLTARTCKRYSGLSDGTMAENRMHHGVIDILLADFAYDLISDPQFPHRSSLQPNQPDWRPHVLPGTRGESDYCQSEVESGRCNGPMAVATGYYAWDSGPLKVHAPVITRTTHVGINRARGVAQDQLLFTEERLLAHESSQSLFACVSVPESKIDVLRNAINGTHYVGRGRSRGNGRIVIQEEVSVSAPELAERLQTFQQAIRAALRPYREVDSRVQIDLPGTLFSVTLASPAILHQAGRPLRIPTPASLGLPAAGIECIRAWARTEVVGGWDSAAGLPRRRAMATRAGSVFLFWAPPEVNTAQLSAALLGCERNGVGDERERGYGQLVVCAPFHAYEGN
jgi:CRISPR-associated protein Csx10